MKKLLLTGASGFLGWNILQNLNDDIEAHCVTHHSNHLKQKFLYKEDISKENNTVPLFEKADPDLVIHAAAISDANQCQKFPDETEALNVKASVLLAKLCAEKNIPFVFISSDLVFDGEKGNYSEDDFVNPISKYGEQKAKAEVEILKIYPHAAICRMPMMIGAAPAGKGYLNQFLTTAKKNQPLTLFTDEWRTPIDGASAAKGILLAAEKLHGIWHLGGSERLSRMHIGEKIAHAFQISPQILKPVRQQDIEMAAPRPADVSMNSSKANAAGFHPPLLDEALKKLVSAF